MGQSKPHAKLPSGQSYLKELEIQANQKHNYQEKQKLVEKNKEMESIYKSKLKYDQVNYLII